MEARSREAQHERCVATGIESKWPLASRQGLKRYIPMLLTATTKSLNDTWFPSGIEGQKDTH